MVANHLGLEVLDKVGQLAGLARPAGGAVGRHTRADKGGGGRRREPGVDRETMTCCEEETKIRGQQL